MPETQIILWTIRIACVWYVAALAALLVHRPVLGRLGWTIGCGCYVAHVWAAFEFQHHWSHAHAVAETARQTGELFGVYWGGGVWFNYLFSVIWVADVAWWWTDARSYSRRTGWIGYAVHGYLAFMFFNGAVVFARGATRLVSGVAAVLLILGWLRFGLRGREAEAHRASISEAR